MKNATELRPDFLVIGSGVAGLRAAIELAARGKVVVLTKSSPRESNTEYAQGGVAVALSEEDEVSLHLHDTLKAGDGLCNEEAVKILVEEGLHVITQLIEWGTQFDRQGTRLAFTKEGAHSRCRVLHSHGDSTGHEIMRALLARARTLRNIEMRPFAFVVDLCVSGGRVEGVEFLDEAKKAIRRVRTQRILLATGGLGQVYRETTNPAVASGDGVALAYRAGAVVSDMEFIQFHPTVLYQKGTPRFLLTEALRGEGAVLRNLELERFMPRYHEAADLAPRDVVSRAIVTETRRLRSEFVYLDLTGLDPDHVRKRFPRVYETCMSCNIDITADLIPVFPAAHYAMGGVHADLEGRSSVAGLYAAGEVAATGVHGANRLASNSLLEGLVFGARTGTRMASDSLCAPSLPAAVEARGPVKSGEGGRSRKQASTQERASTAATPKGSLGQADLEKRIEEVRSLLWRKVGIVRHGEELAAAVERLREHTPPPPHRTNRRELELRNIHQVAEIIAGCALARRESVGAHYRSDFLLKSETEKPKHSFTSKDSPVHFA